MLEISVCISVLYRNWETLPVCWVEGFCVFLKDPSLTAYLCSGRAVKSEFLQFLPAVWLAFFANLLGFSCHLLK